MHSIEQEINKNLHLLDEFPKGFTRVDQLQTRELECLTVGDEVVVCFENRPDEWQFTVAISCKREQKWQVGIIEHKKNLEDDDNRNIVVGVNRLFVPNSFVQK